MKQRLQRIVSLLITLGVLLAPVALPAAEAATKKTTAKKAATTRKASAATTKKTTTVRKATGKKTTTAKTATSRKGTRRSTKKSVRKAVAPVAFDPARPQTLKAQAAVVVDTRTGEIVWAKNEREPRPIASLTKLMTALVFLDDPRPLTDTVTVTKADITGAGRSHVRAGNRVAVADLLRCSLISSDNAATRTLARSTGLSDAEFARRMNERAKSMGLTQTRYVETTGLDPSNQSTAIDQARLLCAAVDNPTIAEITGIPTYSFRCGRRVETLTNTNRLLRSRSDIVSGKTGFIRPAGYCLATQIAAKDQPHLTTVVLGAQTNASRFSESAKLIDWAKRVLGTTPKPQPAPIQNHLLHEPVSP